VATVLYIEGNNFGPNEAVEVTVVWQVLGESAIYPIDENGQPPKTDLSGYFRLWWSPDINGFCPYPVADGQQQPLQQFNVTAKGVTSGRTASETITLRCP
jgi:hypothetical protein